MSTTAIITFIREADNEAGERVETRSTVREGMNGWPSQVLDTLKGIRDVDQNHGPRNITTVEGIAMMYNLYGMTQVEQELTVEKLYGVCEASEVDPRYDTEDMSFATWAYEVVIDAKHTTDWVLRVGTPQDGMRVEGSFEELYPHLQDMDCSPMSPEFTAFADKYMDNTTTINNDAEASATKS